MGTVPRNRLLVTSATITPQISGQMVYRRTETKIASEKSIVLSTKKTMPR